jgi:hypothetical protein
MGPVEAINAGSADGAVTLTVLGQSYHATKELAQSVVEGDYVVIAAATGGDAVILYLVGSPYVPGVSSVAVKGQAVEVDAVLATVAIGSTTFDYSAQLGSDPSLLPTVGQTFEISGIQPLPEGTVLTGLAGQGRQ